MSGENAYNLLPILLWSLVFAYCVFVAKDFFSPPVMFSGILGIFYSDLFVNSIELNLLSIYILMLFFVILGTYPYVKKFKFNIGESQEIKLLTATHIPVLKIWVLAIPAIACQFYFILDFGGITTYLIAAKFGTREFHGLGPIKTIISSIYPLGIVFFCFYIISDPVLRKKNLKFLLCFQLIVVIFAILTLSRGTLLNYFIILMICWSVLVKKISAKTILFALTFALTIASVYGVVRETFSIEGSDFTFGIEDKSEFFKTEWMEFGTFPLKKVLQTNSNEISYGLTYLTLFTNFIPRAIWPNKPDPGGVVFTRDYAPGLYDEYNQYTTGLIPESIINFGIIMGTLIGLIQLFALMYFSCLLYLKFRSKIFCIGSSSKRVFYTVVYAYFLWSAPFFLTGEFTNIAIGLLIKFIFLYVYYLMMTSKIRMI